MLFNSLTFLVFFVVVFVLHRLIPGWSGKKLLLLVASYIFYAAWNPPYVVVLWFSTTLDWWLARLVWKSEKPGHRRLLLTMSLAANLALLGFFKYGNFLLENAQRLLAVVDFHYAPPSLGIVLPIGISFYTFASLSYTIDVYRKEIKGDAPYLDYALFVSFFPHLVAGPIVRARQLLPQIKAPRSASRDQLGWGLCLVIFGLAAKTVLADALFAPVVDEVYAAPAAHNAAYGWAALFGFSGQIYFDFAGYSLCAIGLALCFGFEFPDNFRQPYAARSFSDFWRRWHITLSTWLRDYLYIPLGGNRHGETRTYLNLVLTMLIGGLWHGASWMFVLWGGLHGAYLAAERFWRQHIRPASMPTTGLVGTLLVFLLVSLTWIPFRAHTPEAAWGELRAMVRIDAFTADDAAYMFKIYAGIVAMLAWQWWLRDSSLEERFGALRTPIQAGFLSVCLVAIFLCSGGDERAFIYFQF
ncbi:MAG TPA: MBOAT family O-acyltransferase [Gammaproteobacteria bacterium]|nr:MBOAT family O-acyltransferase [Gammaproteobacteria bacterium]